MVHSLLYNVISRNLQTDMINSRLPSSIRSVTSLQSLRKLQAKAVNTKLSNCEDTAPLFTWLFSQLPNVPIRLYRCHGYYQLALIS